MSGSTFHDEEIEKLEGQVAGEERRTAECQKEIRRLRSIVRQYGDIEKQITEPDYAKLFEIWSDFDDDNTPKEVLIECLELGTYDSMSFKGFCAGFLAAAKLFKDAA